MKKDFKKIVFRVDACSDIGWGNMIRSLTLAEELKKNNKVIFASIKDKANSEIKKRNFKIFFKKKREKERDFLKRIRTSLAPNILVVDRKYDYTLKDFIGFKKVVIIDNLCPGSKAADLVIFPNAHFAKRGSKKIKQGFKYLILRKEILKAKKKKKSKRRNNIVLATGASDPKKVLLKLLLWLKEMNLNADITALKGESFKFPKELKKIGKDLSSNFRIVSYSLKEILKADIVISTFGMSVYEMIYLKIPVISISHSKENAKGAKLLKKRYGVIEDMGYIDNLNPEKLYRAIKKLLSNKKKYKNIIDGKGAKRIAKLIQ